MPELAAVKESFAPSENTSAKLSLSQVEDLAAFFKSIGATDKPNAMAKDLLPYVEITENDKAVSRCGQPKEDQVAKCFNYDGMPNGGEEKPTGQIHKPMLDGPDIGDKKNCDTPETGVIRRPMADGPDIGDKKSSHCREDLRNRYDSLKNNLGDGKELNIKDPEAIGAMIDKALLARSPFAKRDAAQDLAELAKDVLTQSRGSMTALRKFEEAVNANVKADGKGVFFEAENGKVTAHLVENVSREEARQLIREGKDDDLMSTSKYGFMRELTKPAHENVKTQLRF